MQRQIEGLPLRAMVPIGLCCEIKATVRVRSYFKRRYEFILKKSKRDRIQTLNYEFVDDIFFTTPLPVPIFNKIEGKSKQFFLRNISVDDLTINNKYPKK